VADDLAAVPVTEDADGFVVWTSMQDLAKDWSARVPGFEWLWGAV
jgi:hypothetical protein